MEETMKFELISFEAIEYDLGKLFCLSDPKCGDCGKGCTGGGNCGECNTAGFTGD
jgi:hypothetical protein